MVIRTYCFTVQYAIDSEEVIKVNVILTMHTGGP
jgi:hypothetical protein